jgi:hypothetical protein
MAPLPPAAPGNAAPGTTAPRKRKLAPTDEEVKQTVSLATKEKAETATKSNNSNNTMVQRLLDCPFVALRVTSFLSGGEVLRLQCVSRTWREFISNNDDPLFRTCLEADFPEGQLLVEAFLGSRSSVVPLYKKMYMAFQNRFKLQKKLVGNHVAIPWRRPPAVATNTSVAVTEESTEDVAQEGTEGVTASKNEDVKALAFIFRICDYPESCGFLKWHKERNALGNLTGLDELGFDRDWDDTRYEAENILVELDPLKNEICRCADGEENMELSDALHQVASTYRLSIHAVDLQAWQVLTLLEDAPGEVVDNLATHGPSIYLHTSEMPALFGLPMLGSPFFQNLSESDVNQMQAWNFDDYPHVESLNWASALNLGRLFEHGGDEGSPEGYNDTVYLEDIEFGPFSDVSSIRNRYSISNFLRALMKEKCLDLGSDEDSPPQDVALVLCEETNTPPEGPNRKDLRHHPFLRFF